MAKKYVEIDGKQMEVRKPKKPFYKRIWVWVLAIIVVIAIASGGGEEETVSTGTTPTKDSKQETKKVDDGSKKFNSGVTAEANGLKVTIGDVLIKEDSIEVGMNMANNGSNKVTFYPDQGNAIIGNMQLSANMFMGSGEVSGDFNAGITQEGTIEYLAPEGKTIDVKNIKEIKLDMGDVFDDKTYESENVTITIPVK